jgi:hypothetical protein
VAIKTESKQALLQGVKEHDAKAALMLKQRHTHERQNGGKARRILILGDTSKQIIF